MVELIGPDPSRHDHRIVLHRVTWEQYEQLLEMRGEDPVPRITYLEGCVELMSPSLDHEQIKKALARLLETYAEESGLLLNGLGSWTLKERREDRGLEPDECYTLSPGVPERPDLAIEVVWSYWRVDKLEVYRGFGVPEVWIFKKGKLVVHRLTESGYAPADRSALIPALDLDEMVGFIDLEDQTGAVRTYRKHLRESLTP